jgi:hypothetical protein
MVSVHRSVVYARRRKAPVFAAEYEAAIVEALEQVEDAAYQMALAGSAALIQFILTNRAPTRWKRESKARVLARAQSAVHVSNPTEMSVPGLRATALALLDEAGVEHFALMNPTANVIPADAVEDQDPG